MHKVKGRREFAQYMTKFLAQSIINKNLSLMSLLYVSKSKRLSVIRKIYTKAYKYNKFCHISCGELKYSMIS